MSSRVAIIKRVSLADMASDWGEDCYIDIRPASYTEFAEYSKKDVEKMSEIDGMALVVEVIQQSFIGGRIRVLEGKQIVVADAAEDDIPDLTIDMLNKLFSEIMGMKYDPKAQPPAASGEPKSTPDATSTESLSSTSAPTT